MRKFLHESVAIISQHKDFIFEFGKRDTEVQTEEHESGSPQMRARFFHTVDGNKGLFGWSPNKRSKCHQRRTGERFDEPADPARKWRRIESKTDAVPLKFIYLKCDALGPNKKRAITTLSMIGEKLIEKLTIVHFPITYADLWCA